MRAILRSARLLGTTAAMAGMLGVAGCANTISTQQEARLGAQYAAEINRQLPLVQDRAVQQYINRLGDQIARQVDRRGLDYRFFVVNSDQVNAFAVPGGYVYVNRGLIERTDNMSELAGVLAHEIAHVVERHGVEQMAKMQNAELGVNLAYVLLGRAPSGVEQAALQVGGSAVFASYGRDAEREADMRAVEYLVQTGIDPRGLTSFFHELIAVRRQQPGAVQQWFSTHPLTEERIENVQQAIATLPAERLRGLRATSNDYQNFKQRVSRLPAAPRS